MNLAPLPVAPDHVAPRVIACVEGLLSENGGRLPPVSPASDLERDLGLGSLERVELLTRIEKDFDVHLPDALAAQAATPDALVKAVFLALAAGERGAGHGFGPGDGGALPHGPERGGTLPSVGALAGVNTLVEMARERARQESDAVHVQLLADDLSATPLSYGDLWERARRVAAGLAAAGVAPGDRVCLVLPTSLEFFAGFLGILAAGGVAVPIYPPLRLDDLGPYLERHGRLLTNAGASAVVADAQLLPVARLLAARVPGGATQALLLSSLLAANPTAGVVALSANDLALIQYTSGSTGDPKGVALTHGNLLANMRAIGEGARLGPGDVAVSWLPLYHDMGLIGVWLTAFLHGVPVVLLSPLQFLARPERWLWAFHRYRGTVSPAPNFGYELCCRRVREEDLAGLDLSSWRVALNGAEPVRPETLARFQERFGPHGFRATAMLPVYGLAENAVALTFPPLDREPRLDRVDPEALAREHRAEPAMPGQPASTYVSAGVPLPGCEVRVVATEGPSVEPLRERHEGMVIFRSPSTTPGYFRRPEATAAIRRGEWTESGDLGYFADGELYITGRVKDLVVKGGRKYHPQDIETAAAAVAGIRQGCVVAFDAPDAQTGEMIVVTAETREPAARHAELEQQVAAAVLAAVGTPADRVVLLPPGTLPKTSSGKLRRRETRERFLAGALVRRSAAGGRVRALGAVGWGLGVDFLRRGLRAAAAWGFGLRAWAAALFCLVPGILLALLFYRRPDTLFRAVARVLRTSGRLAGLYPHRLGAELPPGPLVIAANHASYLDAMALHATLGRPVAFTPKLEIFSWPLVGHLVRGLGAVPIERTDTATRLGSFTSARDVLAAGRALQLFPEGTFAPGAGLLKFRLGAFQLAGEAQVPIVPVVIRGTRRALRGETHWPRRARIEVEVLPPSPPPPRDATFRELTAWRDQVRELLARAVGEGMVE